MAIATQRPCADLQNRFGIRTCATGLFTGVSAAALMVTDEAEAQEFVPWGSVSGATDFEHAGPSAELWIPFDQSSDSVTFGFAIGEALIDGDGFVDVGVGHRWLTGPDLGLGVNLSIGYGESEGGANALRGVIGGEIFSGNWDAHLNFQYVDGDERISQQSRVLTDVQVEINDIFMDTTFTEQRLENAQSGFDGEFGYHFYQFDSDGSIDLDLRLAVGGYYYFAADEEIQIGPLGLPLPPVDYDDVYGGTLGAALRYYDLGGLPEGAFLFADVTGQYDNQDDFGGTARIGLSIPFGASEATRLTPIRERLRDPVDRRMMQFNERVIDTRTVREEVFSPFSSTGSLFDTVWFADTQGTEENSGEEGDPTTHDEAVRRSQEASPGRASIVVVQDSDDSSGPDQETDGLTTAGFALSDEQILLNANSGFIVQGEITGAIGMYTPTDDPSVVSMNDRATINGAEDIGSTPLLTVGGEGGTGTGHNVQVIGVGFTNGQIGILVDGATNNLYQDVEISHMSHSVEDIGADGLDGNLGLSGDDGADANGADGDTGGASGGSAGIGTDGTDATDGTDGVDGADAFASVYAAGMRIVDSDGIMLDNVHIHDISASANADAGHGGHGGVGGDAGNGGDAGGGDGVAGDDGSIGDDGLDGSDGLDGTDGDTGTAEAQAAGGTAGTSGGVGENGTDGTDGLAGTTGEGGSALDGSTGLDGNQGDVGGAGEAGDPGGSGGDGGAGGPGDTGADASKGGEGEDVNVENGSKTGSDGREGADSSGTAADGSTGSTGGNGSAGGSGGAGTSSDGAPGDAGSSSVNGANGTPGGNGTDGLNGGAGTAGVAGGTGGEGATGASGGAGGEGATGPAAPAPTASTARTAPMGLTAVPAKKAAMAAMRGRPGMAAWPETAPTETSAATRSRWPKPTVSISSIPAMSA